MCEKCVKPKFKVGEWVTIKGGDPTDGHEITDMETPCCYEPFYEISNLPCKIPESKLEAYDHMFDDPAEREEFEATVAEYCAKAGATE